MPENNNKNEQNMSEILDIIRKSCEDEELDRYDTASEAISDEELKARLREQLELDGFPDVLKSVEASDAYAIDESFLAEAEIEDNGVEEIADVSKNEKVFLKEKEENSVNFAELAGTVDASKSASLNVPKSGDDFYEEALDDQKIIEEADEDIIDRHLENEVFDSRDILEISSENAESSCNDARESEVAVEFENFMLKESRRIADKEDFSLLEEVDDEKMENEQTTSEKSDATGFLEDVRCDDATSVSYDGTHVEEPVKSVADGSEISLLMQLGCEDEILEHYDEESLEKISEQEALKSIIGDDFGDFSNSNDVKVRKERKKSTRDKIFSRYDRYKSQRGGLIVRFVVCAFFALLLLIYEGLPAIGIELPGIMNREDYFFSYVLLGLQIVIFCALPVYKRIWRGARKLFTYGCDTYSMFTVLSVATLIYDISIMLTDGENKEPTFHFALTCVILLALLQEYMTLIAEKRSFEFYFSDILKDGNEEKDDVDAQRCFTLCKSSGKNSVAEKMYAGGSDASKNLYFPIRSESALGFFSAVGNKSLQRNMPMLLLVPSMIFSLLVGIFAFVVSDTLSDGFGGIMLSLFLSLPITVALTSWLPYERLSARFKNDGFAFAGEGSMEQYSDCDMVLFSDTLVFEKCSPSKVNVALYDATSKDVLLGCLSALYSEIGGPMRDVFEGAKNDKLGKCRIKRVAKSGVEAIIGSNYSLLMGSELFMSRYGISFPNAALSNSEDDVFTLCVSVNGRASARIAVRYVLNDMFDMFLHRLAEDGIECVVETFDPMISTELLSRVMPNEKTPISIVHLNARDHEAKKDKRRDRLLFESSGAELGILACYSKLNLHVALSAAKRMKRLRKYVNLTACSICGFGAFIALVVAMLGWIPAFTQLYVLLYWLIGTVGVLTLTLKLLPSKDRYSYELYKLEHEEK